MWFSSTKCSPTLLCKSQYETPSLLSIALCGIKLTTVSFTLKAERNLLKMTVAAHFVEKSKTLWIIFFGDMHMYSHSGNNSRWQLMMHAQMRYQLHFMKTILFGHDSKFKSDNTFDLTILRAFFLITSAKWPGTYHVLSVQTCFGSRPTESKFSMSQDKLVTDWLFFFLPKR